MAHGVAGRRGSGVKPQGLRGTYFECTCNLFEKTDLNRISGQ